MEFVKMQGAGNDFIVVEAASWEIADSFQPYAEWLCHRNWGIGADGLIIMGPDRDFDIFMRIFNPDGTEPEMCGNGIRCAARYARERGMVQGTRLSVRTKAGPRYPEVLMKQGSFIGVKVDMGEPVFDRALIPMAGEGGSIGVKMEIPGAVLEATAVSMGNPHCVIFVEDIDTVPVSQWGPLLEMHPYFPERTNAEFVQVLGSNEMIMRVWERGAGITLACGTGACAVLVAAVRNKRSARSSVIHLLGGDLSIEWSESDNHVYMSGPAVEVFSGRIDLEGVCKGTEG